MAKKINFLNLGKNPITNNFLKLQNPKKNFFIIYNLFLTQKQNLFHLKNLFHPKECLMISMLTEHQLPKPCV